MNVTTGQSEEYAGLDAVVCLKFEDFEPASTSEAMDGLGVRSHSERLGFSPKKGKTLLLPSAKAVRAVLVSGAGKKESYELEALRMAVSSALCELSTKEYRNIGILLPGMDTAEKEAKEVSYIAELTMYSFDEFKSEKKKGVDEIRILSDSSIDGAVETGIILGRATNLTRYLSDLPSAVGTPSVFEKNLREIKGLKVTALGREDFIKLGMGGLEGVSRGAHEPAKLLIAEYGDPKMPAIMFVGKGITFDSGGISIKPAEGMGEMKFDKCGAAAVLGAIKAISELKIKVHIIGLMPLTENMPGGGSYKPGEILRHYNGVTSEVISTDAEGRLVLADALAYGIKEYNPSSVIDLATLTGACIVALGNNIAGMMGNDGVLQAKVSEASKNSWEKLWPLPLDDEFKEQIKSDVADIKNSGGRQAGAEAAGAFLSHFVGDVPWVHLDIAGTAWKQQKSTKRSYLGEGATGFGTRLLVEFAKSSQ
ncbi:MAG: leucyl aminopeptidase [Thermoplasmataceae archaeon]